MTPNINDDVVIEKVIDPVDHFVKSEVKYINYKGYMGNPLLKRPGVEIEWTPETVAEYAKCAKDPIYFIETYIKIVHVDFGLIPFLLRDYQKQIILGIHENRRVIMVLPRQSGKSTAVIGYILWYILFNNHVNAALLANKAPTAREILSKLQLAYIHLPKFLQQGIIEWNKGSIILENGSRAFADATSSDAIRGYAINLLVLDEAAHVEGWEAFSTSVLPTITSGTTTKVVQISTPFGLNHFYKTWMDAQPNSKQPNGYYPIQVHWRQVPGRDDKWMKETLQTLNNDMDKFAQEYECVTGDTLITLRDKIDGTIHRLTIAQAYATMEFLAMEAV
jgi:Terminase large subunit, T4likevirus-type, N-terminal